MTLLDIVAHSGDVWWDGFQVLQSPHLGSIIVTIDSEIGGSISINCLHQLFGLPPLVIQGTDMEKAKAIYIAYSRFHTLIKPPLPKPISPQIIPMSEERRASLRELELAQVTAPIGGKRRKKKSTDAISVKSLSDSEFHDIMMV